MENYGQPETLPLDLALDEAATEFAEGVAEGLSGAAREALSDPIVVALMKADRVDKSAFEALLRRMSATLANPAPAPCPCAGC